MKNRIEYTDMMADVLKRIDPAGLITDEVDGLDNPYIAIANEIIADFFDAWNQQHLGVCVVVNIFFYFFIRIDDHCLSLIMSAFNNGIKGNEKF